MTPEEINKLLAANNLPQTASSGGDLSKIIGRRILPKPIETITSYRGTQRHLSKLLTVNRKMLDVKEQIKTLADLDYTVLILGESGTGKEMLARALHGERSGRFIAINCGGFPEHLVDSILFGHVRGSFTGAERDKTGLFLAAQNGTIFLDEISELPLHMQAKLLRVLQEQEINPVGSNDVIKISVRIVAATNNLLIKSSPKFRTDLYWRLSSFIVHTIPLRERKEDVHLYLESTGINISEFYRNFELHKGYAVDQHPWDGNYRELQQLINRYKVFNTIG